MGAGVFFKGKFLPYSITPNCFLKCFTFKTFKKKQPKTDI